MRIVSKPVARLTPREYKMCYSLNMRGGGTMMYCLSDERRGNAGSIAILAWDGDVLAGWTLLTPTDWRGLSWLSPYARRTSKYTAQFWVRQKYRRQGVATRLMKAVLKHDERPHVMPWDTRSAAFFADYTVTADSYRRKLITAAKKNKRLSNEFRAKI